MCLRESVTARSLEVTTILVDYPLRHHHYRRHYHHQSRYKVLQEPSTEVG